MSSSKSKRQAAGLESGSIILRFQRITMPLDHALLSYYTCFHSQLLLRLKHVHRRMRQWKMPAANDVTGRA